MHKMLVNVPQAHYKDSLVGAMPELLKNLHRRHDWFADITKGLPVSKLIRGPKSDPNVVQLLVRDPAVIKHFLKDNFDNYTKPPSHRDFIFGNLRIWLGTGIFVERHGPDSEDGGKNWARQRKIASNIFSRGNFNNNMNDVFVKKGERLCKVLKEAAEQGTQIDMQGKFFQYTMDSIMQIFFGEVADTVGGETNKYATAYDTAHRCLVEYSMKTAPMLLLAKLLPWPFGGLNGLTAQTIRAIHPLFREFKNALHTLDVESRRLVSACCADPAIAERKDLLALFVQSERETAGAGTQTQALSAEWLRDVVLNFVLAGRDTTACTLSWMFYILSTHPDIQQKVQDEIDAKFAAGAKPSIKSVSSTELPYLHGLLYETLRLYPPVPVDGKEAVADDVFPDGTPVPMHTNVAFMVYAMGRDPALYPEPEVVRPERWIPFKEPSPYEFPVFQAGPRICLGMNMAIFEAKIAAVMLLQEYSFELLAGEAEKITYLPTALTMSICNTGRTKDFDSHNLWLIPKSRR